MPIASPIGFLDVVNATLRASQVETTSRLTVANTAATKNFSVGDRFHVDKDSVDPVSVTGNVVASGIKISNLTISPTFDLAAVSNVGNTTSNTLQFANATTGFTTTANVEIGGNITLTSNAQVKVGSNVLAEYTGPHGREPKEMPLKKYPEIAFDASKLDGNDTTNTYTQAGYTVTASSQWHASYAVHHTFNDVLQDNEAGAGGILWTSATSTYPAAGGDYVGTTYGIGTTYGEFIKLELPYKIKPKEVRIFPRTYQPGGSGNAQSPAQFKIFGSNDNFSSEIVELYHQNTDWVNNETWGVFDISHTTHFKHFGIVFTKTNKANIVGVQEIEYYGTEEPAPPGDLSLDTTLKSTFNSVRSNNYVMYFDGDGFIPDDNTSNNLVDNKSVIHHNATYDSTGKYWTLDGSTESNVTTGSLGLVGDTPHTVSTWINASNLEANALTQQLFSIGSGYDKAFLKVDDTQIAANTWHNVTYAYQGEGGSKVTYVDGRKVEEAQVEDTFGEYPPFVMTDYKTGGYCASASNYQEGDYYPWEAFADGVNTVGWYTNSVGNYNGANGTVTSTSTVRLAPETEKGDWLKLEFPYLLRLNYFILYSQAYERVNAPDNYIVYGSKDDITWTSLSTHTGVAPASGTSVPGGYTGMVGVTETYKYFAWVFTKRDSQSATNGIAVRDLKLYGHKEGDLTRFPEPTRVLKYPHVEMTGPAQRGYVASASSFQQAPYLGFTPATSTQAWVSGNTTDYDGGSNDYNATTYRLGALVGGGNTEYGEWLKLELPHKLAVNKMILAADPGGTYGINEAPDAWRIYGSNDDTNWVELLSVTGATPTTSGDTRTITNTTAYKYLAIVLTSVHNITTNTRVGGLEYFGTQENTGTPAIVGGPFAGKVANFRVYDQYLGDERIQEIYDAQKDEFGHKKSSMTFYKGRIGVGTTEPEGSLTVLDEPHALQKFPVRAISADDSYVEGDGQIKLSAADGSGYQAFDGLTSTSWTATPTRNTRVSEEVDFGAWLKIQTPESMSLKKAEIESRPDWAQVGAEIQGSLANDHFGRSVACSHDGTRVIAGGYTHSSNQGNARVYDWNGTTWELIGNQTITGTADNDQFARQVAISGDGNIIAIAAPYEHVSGDADKGVVRVYYLNGSTWTILPDSGSLTETETGFVDAFVGSAVNIQLGNGTIQLSYDGKTIAMCEYGYNGGAGRVLVYKYSNGAWSYKGTGATQFVGSASSVHFGFGLSMSEDGNCLAIGTLNAGYFVEVYSWDGTDWNLKGSRINQPSTSTGVNDYFGQVVGISNDGNTLAVGMKDADLVDGARVDNGGLVLVYHWTGSAWGTPHKLQYDESTDEEFGLGLALSGDGKRLLVTAGAENNYSSEIFTFEYTGTSWVMRTPGVQGLLGVTGGHLGWGWVHGGHPFTISRDGSTIVAGELGYDTPASNAGRFRVFSMPSNIKSIWGSNDDVNWTKITTAPTREEATSNVAGLAFGYDDRLEFKNLDNPNYYKYHAIIADAFTQLKDVKLFGVRNQGSSTLHDGALTLTKNLDVPRIGPPPDADDTPRRDRLVVEYNTSTNPVEDGLVQDTSGRGLDACMKGSTSYLATEKALDIAGTPNGSSAPSTSAYLEVGQRLPFKGNQQHTISFWYNKRICPQAQGLISLWKEGTNYGSVGHHSGILQEAAGKLSFWHWGDDQSFTDPLGDSSTGWRHVVAVYTGTTVADQELYINGIRAAFHSYGSGNGTQSIDITNAKMTMGQDIYRGNYYFQSDTEFSGIKVYDTALTAQEVKTLYDMGRCDEGHHTVNFSKTRVGIGLGDEEVPQAALDVRGSLRIPTTSDGTTNGLIKINPDNLDLEFCTTRHNSSQAQPATGGTLSYPSGDTTLHKFVSSGFFTVTTGPLLVEYIILAGGGSGGYNHGGGGGGGGYCRGVTKVSVGTHRIIVGAGGAAGASAQIGSNGGDSYAFGITTKGGGYGGARGANNSSSLPSERGNSGGSGGGGAGTATVYGASGGTITLGGSNIIYADEWRSVRNDHSIQGCKGGIGISGADTTNAGNGGGGGGAGAAGGNASGGSSGAGSSGAGGSGLYDDFEIDSTAGTPAVQPSASGGGGMIGRGGGGSGGRWSSGTIGYPADNTSAFGGGAGGGQNNLSQFAHAGVDQKGGGGGGGPDGGGSAGSGGDGIVMIRYFRPVVRTGAGNP